MNSRAANALSFRSVAMTKILLAIAALAIVLLLMIEREYGE